MTRFYAEHITLICGLRRTVRQHHVRPPFLLNQLTKSVANVCDARMYGIYGSVQVALSDGKLNIDLLRTLFH